MKTFLQGAYRVLAEVFAWCIDFWIWGNGKLARRVRALRRQKVPSIPRDRKIIWLHAASAGEFEQGRPVLEYLIAHLKPHPFVVVTFFSPSGFERYQTTYPLADWVGYLPWDAFSHVRPFIEALHPDMVLWVKYDLWPTVLHELRGRNIPTYLIAAHWSRARLPFWQREVLRFFRHIFVQTEGDEAILQRQGLQVTVAGDTRAWRVQEIARSWLPVPGIVEWVGKDFCIVAGSVWQEDVAFLAESMDQLRDFSIKWILVPHELSEKNFQKIQRLWDRQISFYSRPPWKTSTLLVDRIGILAYLYAYAHVVWVGGGFGKGIHNILEPLVYGKPVAFGPNWHRFAEAQALIQRGLAKSCKYPASWASWVRGYWGQPARLEVVAKQAEEYFASLPPAPFVIGEKILKDISAVPM
ncbi:MAG: 3-deoxy-D-manno-octulosonic acid transferase [Bacteroidia bacterium]